MQTDRPFTARLKFVLPVLFLAAALAPADERLFGIACRSVHLRYVAGEGRAFHNEVTVEHSAPGTYFCVCGFSKGYFGIQELASGKKLVLFSVWDGGSENDPNKVPEDRRVRVLYQAADVRVGRFGNEGTGAQAFFDYDWKVDQPCKCLVTAKLDGERTAYSAYFFLPEKQDWHHLATFSTRAGGKLLSGYYSFVEDFRRDRVSTTRTRQARFGNGWIWEPRGTWTPLTEARFTADANPAMNVNAGALENTFFLTTGGATKNTGTTLGHLCRQTALPGDARMLKKKVQEFLR